MKNILLQPLLWTCLLFLSSGLSAQLPFNEGFESGDFINGAWSVSGNLQISTLQPAAGIYCARGEASYGFNRVFEPIADSVVTLEFQVKTQQTNTTALIFRIKESTKTGSPTCLGTIMRNNGQIVGLDGTNQINLLPYPANRWIKFRFVIRIPKKTYDLYIDDVLKASNYQFYSDQCEVFSFFTWSSVEQQGLIFFDEIKLYSNSLSSQHEANSQEQCRISPNPFDKHLSIKAGDALSGATFTIYDLSGRKLRVGTLNTDITLIELDEIPPGFYLLRVGEMTTPIIKGK